MFSRSSRPSRVLAILAMLLIGKVLVGVVLGFRDYFPPNFQSDFLRGREAYFWGAYRWAFYVHLFAGPLSLVFGMILICERFRRSVPHWHRRLGRMQIANVLLLVVPSGLWMAWYAATGGVAATGLASLAIATGTCVGLGWKSAIERRFNDHRRWMSRTFILLSSAIIIRIISGVATVLRTDALWVYPVATWGSWLVPLLVFEWRLRVFPTGKSAAVL